MSHDDKKTYPEGYFVGRWMAIGMAIFAGFGVVLSVSTDNPGLIGIGPALGISFGLSVGSAIEKRHAERGQIRPKTAEEKAKERKALYVGIAVLVVGVAFFLWQLLG